MRALLLLLCLNILAVASVKNAQKMYEHKNYLEAIKELKKSTSEYGNPKLHLIWAKSASAIGHNIEAMSAYERVLMLEPSNIKAKKSLIKIYVKLKKNKLAKAIIHELKEEDLDFKEVKIINEKDVASHSIKGSGSFAVGYDDNINISADKNLLDTYYATTVHPNEISSIFYRATANINFLKEITSNWYVKASLNGYYNVNGKTNQYNIFLSTTKFGIGYYNEGNYNIYMPISYSTLHYLTTDLLKFYSISPQIDIFLSKDMILSLNSKFERKSFLNAIDKNRDETSTAIGATLYYKFDKNFVFLDTEYQKFTSNRALAADFVDRETITVVAGVNYRFTEDIIGKFSYKVIFGDYDDVISNPAGTPTTELRDDTFHQLNFKVSKKLSNNLNVFIENEYTTNSSNHIPADYDKNVFMVGIGLKF